MKTAIKYDRLASLSDEQRLKVLAGAIDFELKKPQLALEMAKSQVLANNVKGMKAANDVGFDRIKSFFATKYATSSDNPELTDLANEFEQFFHSNMPEFDMGFELLFDMVDLRNSTHDHFDILDTSAGLTWTQHKPGEITKIRRAISESKTTVNHLEFRDGLGLLDTWLKFNQFWTIDEAIAEFRATYYDKMASHHYGLLTALGSGVNVAFSTDDVTTANNAAAAILRAMRNKGVGASQASGFYAVCEPEQVGRLEKMLTAQRGSAIVDQGTVGQPLAYRIQGIIGTTHIPASHGSWYLVLPGRKLKRGVWQDMTVESTRNAYAKAEDLVGVGMFNAAIGDSDQVRRVAFS